MKPIRSGSRTLVQYRRPPPDLQKPIIEASETLAPDQQTRMPTGLGEDTI